MFTLIFTEIWTLTSSYPFLTPSPIRQDGELALFQGPTRHLGELVALLGLIRLLGEFVCMFV